MIIGGILNPHLLALLARVRHTNALVIADRGFPSWPGVETMDISLIDGVPTVLQVLTAVRQNHRITAAFMAREFSRENGAAAQAALRSALFGVAVRRESHLALKRRVPQAIGIIRTGDTTPYANLVLISG